MKVGASFVAGAEAFELVQPGEGALDDPAHFAQSGAVGDAASGDQGFDAVLAQQAAVPLEVVAPVGVQTQGLAAGTSPNSPDRWDGVQKRQELSDVVPVAPVRVTASGKQAASVIRWCLLPALPR